MPREVHVCAPAAKVIPGLIDLINGPAGQPQAVTIGDTTFYFIPNPTIQLVAHERRHVQQAIEREPKWFPTWGPLGRIRKYWGWARFWDEYAENHAKFGYWDNPLEVEARAAE